MAASKQTSTAKSKRASKAVVGRGMSKSRKNVKVVEVKLSTKQSAKKQKAAKAASSRTASNRTASAAKKGRKSTAKKATAKKSAGAAKKASPKKKAGVKAKTPAKNAKPRSASQKNKKTPRTPAHTGKSAGSSPQPAREPAEKAANDERRDKKTARREEQLNQFDEMLEIAASPSAELLRPFRAAAKMNRKLAREKMRARRKNGSFLAKAPRKGKQYLIDLRVHSPATRGYFSPGGVEPAAALVRLAKVKGLHLVGLTDFYHAGYVDKVRALAENSKVNIIPGLDLRCTVGDCSSVSITVLFPEETTTADLFRVLDELKVPESAYGRSDYCVTLPFEEVLEIIEKRNGLVIPSRVDKTPYCQLAIPVLIERFGIHAFDLVHPENPEYFRGRWPDGEFTFFSFSNANALGQIGNRAAKVKLETPDFEGLRTRIQRRIKH